MGKFYIAGRGYRRTNTTAAGFSTVATGPRGRPCRCGRRTVARFLAAVPSDEGALMARSGSDKGTGGGSATLIVVVRRNAHWSGKAGKVGGPTVILVAQPDKVGIMKRWE